MATLTETFSSKVRVVKIDADAQFEMMKQFGLRAIPALVLMQGDTRIDERIGLQSYHDLSDWLNSYLT
ncbi:hypothetical protein D210916BOD24_04680 [Alteromonas sp. D210916BOD_24]